MKGLRVREGGGGGGGYYEFRTMSANNERSFKTILRVIVT